MKSKGKEQKEKLSQREDLVLKSAIADFVQNGYPVSSNRLREKYISNISSATIRNTMNELERRGYLMQPHISAGRIPTDKGYRYYVDNLSETNTVKEKINKIIKEDLFSASNDVILIMEKTSRLLSELSSELGISVFPKFSFGILEKIELFSLTADKLMVILRISSGLIKTVVIELDTKIKESRLPLIKSILNERLYRMPLADIINGIAQRFSDLPDDEVIGYLIKNAPKIFDFSRELIAKMSGTENLIVKPDFHDPDKIRQIVTRIENGTIIAHIYETRKLKPGIMISIGSENEDQTLFDCSVITKDYKIVGSEGLVAVIGPKRMNYSKSITLVDCVADMMTLLFEQKRELMIS
jgi:heat-inducible transcriptional repressor